MLEINYLSAIIQKSSMSVKSVLKIGNKELRKISKPVKDINSAKVRKTMQDLRDTLQNLQKKHKIGRALAAPQIGQNIRMIYFNLEKSSFIAINPEIIRHSRKKSLFWDSWFWLVSWLRNPIAVIPIAARLIPKPKSRAKL